MNAPKQASEHDEATLYPSDSLIVPVSGGATAQAPPLTLRQAIDRALGQNPQAAIAHAGEQDANAAAALARTALLPQLSFTEDISRGNDPVYVFGERLRQRQFTQADFALNALNRPQPIGNFSSRFSGSWMAFDSFKTRRRFAAPTCSRRAPLLPRQAANQQIVLHVVEAYQAVLYAQREVDVAEHEAADGRGAAHRGRRARKGRPRGRVGPHVGPGESRRAQAGADCARRATWNWRGPSCARQWARRICRSPQLQPIEPHEFPATLRLKRNWPGRQDAPRPGRAGHGPAGAGRGGRRGPLRLRPARQRLRQLGRRPRLAHRVPAATTGWPASRSASTFCPSASAISLRARAPPSSAIDAQMAQAPLAGAARGQPGAHSARRPPRSRWRRRARPWIRRPRACAS